MDDYDKESKLNGNKKISIPIPKKTNNTINDDLDKVRKMKMERAKEIIESQDFPTTVDSITELLNETNIIQKSRKNIKQVFSSSLIRTKNELLRTRLGITNKVSSGFNDTFELEIISLNGLGREELIQMAQSLTEHQLMQNQVTTKPPTGSNNALINVNPPIR